MTRHTPKRINVGLIPKVARDLAEISLATGLGTTDVVNQAISLSAFVHRQLRAGGELLVRDPATGDIGRVRLL